jgi:hypothetical protein
VKEETEVDSKIVISNETIKSWNLYIAVPCYDNSVTEPFMMSTIKTMLSFSQIGMRCSISTIADSLISRARNMLVAKFMANPEYTHLLFIDSDISYSHESILKLLWHDKDVIAAAYPVKEINWAKTEQLVKDGVPIKEAVKQSARFAVSAIKPGQERVDVSNGAIAAYDLGTGFMLIKRETIEKMIKEYPELKFNDDTGSLNEEERKYTYNFFDPYIDESNRRYLSEDYAFCRYWQNLGGKTWLDPSIELDHIGRFRYTGSPQAYVDTLMTLPK